MLNRNDQQLIALEAIARGGFDATKRAESWFELATLVKEDDIERARLAVEEGMLLLDQLLDDDGEVSNQPARLDGLLLRGEIAMRSGSRSGFEQAISDADAADAILGERSGVLERIRIANLRGFALHRLDRFEESLDEMRTAISLAEEGELYEMADLARIRVATTLYESGRGSEAHSIIDEVEQSAAGRDDLKTKAKGDRCRAGIYYRSGEYGRSISYYRSAKTSYAKNESQLQQARLLHDMAGAYGAIGDSEEALRVQIEALDIFRKAESVRGVALCLNNIGNDKLNLGEYREALLSLEEAGRLKRELGDLRGLVVTLRNIGYAHQQLGQFEDAELVFADADELNRSIDDPVGRTGLLMDRADLAIVREQMDVAEELLTEGEAIAQEIGFLNEEAGILVRRAHVATSTGRAEAALALLARAESKASKAELASIGPDIEQRYSEAYERLENYPEALAHLRQSNVLTREIESKNSRERLQHALVVHDTEQARAARQIAEQKREIAERESERLAREAEVRSKELMATALFLTQKNEILREVARELQGIVSDESRGIEPQVEALRRRVVDATDNAASWKTFEEQFRRVHEGFLEEVARLAPDLTPTEIKVCALAKSGLSTKETAAILAIEPRSIEKYRQRARKKLGLERQTNLVAYLQRVQNSE